MTMMRPTLPLPLLQYDDRTAVSISTVMTLRNLSGAAVLLGSCVKLALAGGGRAFTTSTTVGDERTLGIALEAVDANSFGRIAFFGRVRYARVASGSTDGQALRQSGTAGVLEGTNIVDAGAIAIQLGDRNATTGLAEVYLIQSRGSGTVQLARTELTGNTTTVTFASILGGGSALMLTILARSADTEAEMDNVQLNFNNDVTGYDNQFLLVNNATVTGGENIGLGFALAGLVPKAGTTADKFGSYTLWIPGYDDAAGDHDKTLTGMGGGFISEATGGGVLFSTHNVWRGSGATAITEIDLTLTGGDFLAGSEFALYKLS